MYDRDIVGRIREGSRLHVNLLIDHLRKHHSQCHVLDKSHEIVDKYYEALSCHYSKFGNSWTELGLMENLSGGRGRDGSCEIAQDLWVQFFW